MGIPGSANPMLLGGAAGYEIEQGLRFQSANSTYLIDSGTRTTTTGAYTFSFWVKRWELGTAQAIWSSEDSSGLSAKWSLCGFGPDNYLYWWHNSGNDADAAKSNGLLRDPSAWYHIVLSKPAGSAGTMYINGVAQTKQTITNDSDAFANAKYIGRRYNATRYSNLYLAEFYGIDGTALTASSFGETDDNGVWRPIEYTGSYGSAGFYLDFSNSSDLGEDQAGSNDFTATSFTTSGTGTDVMSDTPTTNWCTLNPLNPTSATLSDGNLSFSRTGKGGATSSVGVDSGKFYFEVTGDADIGQGYAAGFVQDDYDTSAGTDIGESTTSFGARILSTGVVFKPLNGTSTSITGQTNNASTVFAFAVNFDTGGVEIYRNGSSIHTQTLTLPAGKFFPAVAGETNSESKNIQINFGQRAFAYTPPTGYKALNTKNLPAPGIADGSDYFNTVLYSGTGSNPRSVSGVGFQPSLLWIKRRSGANLHHLVDEVRGASNALASDSTLAEFGSQIGSLDSDGFTTNSNAGNATNASGSTYVAWNWLAGGSGSSNTAGSITSTVSASPSSGFSIVSYTGNGSSNQTVGHGLGTTPAMVIVKDRDSNTTSNRWFVWHQSLSSGHNIYLEDTGASFAVSSLSSGGIGGSPTSTTFTLQNGSSTNNNVNENNDRFIGYCFAEVEGFSKFGSYTGNGSSDGPFVFCGFKPQWVMIKRTDSSGNWQIYDTARDTDNKMFLELVPNSSAEENSTSLNISVAIDAVSNGFKLKDSDTAGNASGGTYLFAAFSSHPFGGSGVSPATAR